jgi:hypothetical protein
MGNTFSLNMSNPLHRDLFLIENEIWQEYTELLGAQHYLRRHTLYYNSLECCARHYTMLETGALYGYSIWIDLEIGLSSAIVTITDDVKFYATLLRLS